MTTAFATIRVLIADDHAVVREGVRHVLGAEHGYDVVGEAADGAQAIRLAQLLQPDVVVLDLSMPGVPGLDAARQIRQCAPSARILVFSIHDHAEYVQQSALAGAQGYLRKDSSPAQLRDAIRTVHQGATTFIDPSPPRTDDRVALLSPRERDVLMQIARALSTKEIAAALGISARTVEAHRDSLSRKLQLRGAAALTRFAMEHGLTAP